MVSYPVNQYRVLNALPVLGQPRDAKRISMLQTTGFTIEAVAFERNHHSGRLPDCPITLLGKISNGEYLRRSMLLLFAIPAMRRAIRRNHLVYASGPDMALLAIIANFGLGRPIILEVGDIRKAQISSGMIGSLVRIMDRFVAGFSKLLVATAPDFIDGYYRKRLSISTPAIVLENKLETSNLDINNSKSIPSLTTEPLCIGYFGVLRCNWSWQVLESLALSNPDSIEIVVAGHILEPVDLDERAAMIPNIHFRGEFSSPQDLPSLYGDVDLIWACYPPPEIQDVDWRWAQLICRSNRFYESCFFQKPIISVAESGDAKEVEKYGIGMIIGDQSIDAVVDALKSVTEDDMIKWNDNLSTLPKHVYEYTSEVTELGDTVKNIIEDYLSSGKKHI